MRNDEFDRRMRAFFAEAPRPSAPDALRRLPATLMRPAQDRGRVWPPQVHRGRGLAGIGMAGLVVAVVLAVALSVRMAGPNAASSGSPGSASAGSPGPNSPSPTASPTSSASRGSAYALGGLAWQEVGVGTFAGVENLALFPIDQGLLVVGTSRTAQVRLWLSADGSHFQPLDALAFASDDPATHQVVVRGLVKGPAGYVAVGTRHDPDTPGQPPDQGASPLVWHSEDGLHWSRVETHGLPAAGLAAIAATNNGYVVAPEPTYTDSSFTPYPACASADGTSWQATPVIARDVVGHDGHVVAVTYESAVAVTDDGRAWTTLHPAKQVDGIEVSPDGFIAFTEDPANARAQWRVIRSADGLVWTNVGAPAADWRAGMVYAMGRWVTLDYRFEGSDRTPLLTSPDGLIWQSRAIPYEVVGGAMINNPLYPFQDGFFAETHVQIDPGSSDAYGPLQVHLWWVREARAGDTPGSTAPPELPGPTIAPVLTPPGGISEALAISIASARYPSAVTKPYGKLATIGGFDPKQTLVPQDRWVWAVMVIVPKPECSPQASPRPSSCELPYTSVVVIVDYLSGDIIEVLDSNP